MERWNDTGYVPIELPGSDEPKTVFWVRQLGDDELAVMEGSLERLRDTHKKAGRDVNDAEHLRKEAEVDRVTTASAIEKMENVYEPGDSVTNKEEISGQLAKMAAGRYRVLRGVIVGSLDISAFERKASSS